MKSSTVIHLSPLFFAVAICISFFITTTAGAVEKRSPLKLDDKKTLFLRVLTRPVANIYKEANSESGTVKENVAAFQPFFVYAKKDASDLEPQGWYEVGSDSRGTVLGWMKADDVFEWKQTMCLAYAHPGESKQVLMFDTRAGLEKYLAMPTEKRKVEVEQLYKTIESGIIPESFPVKSISPKMAVDIQKEFYLLPILSSEAVEIDGREGRILQIAAATKADAKARESSDIRINQEYLEQANLSAGEASAQTLDELTVDLVWVMDTTNSMAPYIQQTLNVVGDVSQQISKEKSITAKMRFGIWGYRDSEQIPGIGYNTHNYTPALQSIDQFVPTVQKVEVTTAGSKGYAEDLFSGMAAAIEQTQWTPGAMRLIVLVGDAPSHRAGHKWNESGMSELTLRALATERKIAVIALHIKDVNPKASKYHDLAQEQFEALSMNRGMGQQTSYMSIASDNLPDFELKTHEIAWQIIDMLQQIKTLAKVTNSSSSAGNLDLIEEKVSNLDLLQENESSDTTKETTLSSESIIQNTLKAALTEWIGSQAGAQAPRDIVAWVADKDLMNPASSSLDVRFLINKNQLNSLYTTLQAILEAGNKGTTSGDDFFSTLQAAAAISVRDPDKIKKAETLAESGLIPEFLSGLPYESTIMSMDNEYWGSWSPDAQEQFVEELLEKIVFYEMTSSNDEGWVQLNRGDDPDEYVFPIPLSQLP